MNYYEAVQFLDSATLDQDLNARRAAFNVFAAARSQPAGRRYICPHCLLLQEDGDDEVAEFSSGNATYCSCGAYSSYWLPFPTVMGEQRRREVQEMLGAYCEAMGCERWQWQPPERQPVSGHEHLDYCDWPSAGFACISIDLNGLADMDTQYPRPTEEEIREIAWYLGYSVIVDEGGSLLLDDR